MPLRLAPWVLLVGCESVEPEGEVFAPVVPPPPAAVVEVAPAPPAPAEPAPVAATPEPEPGPEPTVPEPAPAPPAPAAPPVAGPSGWPVRLVSTLPDAQPPRAILGLPSGEERVVSPGTMIPEEGLVVMSVAGDRVQLARVAPAGDHATVTTLDLAAQYPASR